MDSNLYKSNYDKFSPNLTNSYNKREIITEKDKKKENIVENLRNTKQKYY